MVLTEKSQKRLSDFFTESLRVKDRFPSLESFHENADELEVAEFYEEHSELMLLFMFECYLLMICKTWIKSKKEGNFEVLEFAFGKDVKFPSVLDVRNSIQSTNENGDEDEDGVSKISSSIDDRQFKYTDKLQSQCQKVQPVNDSKYQDKWINSLKKHSKPDSYMKFPVVFSKLLQYTTIDRILSSPLANFLLGMITRLLHADNLAILRIEGLKMLLNLLKAASHESSHPIIISCTEIFGSLIDTESLGASTYAASIRTSVSLTDLTPLIKEKLSDFERSKINGNLEMLNEIFSFITWDLNPDLHSTKFLYNLIRDNFLFKLFPIASQKDHLSLDAFDKNVNGAVLEMVIDYFSLWFLKSNNRPYNFGSSLIASTENLSFKNQFGSMVSLVVNDLTNFLGVGGSSTKSSPSTKKNSRSSIIHNNHKNELPVSSFLLEEIILGSKKDLMFVHYILKSSCFTLSLSSHLFSIRLTLEIFRSWLFNTLARRPQFLQNLNELDVYVSFYMDSIEGLFPHRHLKCEDNNNNSINLLDVYKEGIYFYRAVALQAFFTLSLERWIHLLSIEIEVINLLLNPENSCTSDDALLAETLLGSLMRSSEFFVTNETIREKWMEASNVLTKASSSRGVIEEWCRVIESLVLLVVKDPRYFGCIDGNNLFASTLSRNASLSCSTNNSSSLSFSTRASSSTLSLHSTIASFSSWTDLATVQQNSLVLFRNVLRIIGDPASTQAELINNRPDLMFCIYESMERCFDVLLKCRLEQAVKISMKIVPPLGDFLPTALSALLNLKSATSIVSSNSDENESQEMDVTSTSTLSTAHDASRIIAWRMVGITMFRPADIIISDHYWGALLVALKESLSYPLSCAEITAIIVYVGIPVSSAQVLGTTVILTNLVEGMLKFFKNALNSNNTASDFSITEAIVLIPATMKIISNCLKLSKIFPKQFGYFREESVLPSLIKMLIESISDSGLLKIIHTTLAEVYCTEIVTDVIESSESDKFVQSIIELMMEDPFKFRRGKWHVPVLISLSEFISAIAHLKVADPANNVINCDYIISKLIECIEIGDESKEDYSEALVRIIQGPLSDWIFYVNQGKFSDESMKHRICKLIDLKFISFKSVRCALDQFTMKFLTLSSAFPSLATAEFIGSEGFESASTSNGTSLINLVLTPSQTILSFDERGNEIWITARNSIGKFIWKMRDNWQNENEENKDDLEAIKFAFNVKNDSEFPLPKNSSPDVLKTLFAKIRKEFPETIIKPRTNLLILDENWKDQKEYEEEIRGKAMSKCAEFKKFESKRPVYSGGRISCKLRLLLSSLSLTLPELYTNTQQSAFGIEVLKSESSSGGKLEDELKLLDGISGRLKVKIGCIRLFPGISNESDLFDHVDTECLEYEDFISSFIDLNKGKLRLSTPSLEIEIDDLCRMKREIRDKMELKKHLGNDSVLVIWHGDNDDTVIDAAPFRSDVTSAIIRIRSHSSIPGWYRVTLQTCYERLLQPRKYARVRVDPFTLVDTDINFDFEVNGVFKVPHDGSIQRDGILVPMGSLGALVRALSCSAWRQTYLIDCLRSCNSTIIFNAENRVKYSPESVRKERIEEIYTRHGMNDLPYDQFISNLFRQ